MKKLKIKTFLLLFSICILSCNTNKKIERQNEPTIYNVEENDVEMNKAIEKANQTIDSFDYAFKNNSRVFTFFGLKKKFEENGNIEHIWIGNIQKIESGKYIGDETGHVHGPNCNHDKTEIIDFRVDKVKEANGNVKAKVTLITIVNGKEVKEEKTFEGNDLEVEAKIAELGK